MDGTVLAMSARGLIGTEIGVLGTGIVEIQNPDTIRFDFGGSLSEPSDLHLPSQPAFSPGCRVVIVLGGSVDAHPTTEDDGLVFAVYDAEDDGAGRVAVDTLAPAITDDGERVGPVGYRSITIGLQMRADRPWLRVEATKDNSTKVTGRAVVLAFPAGC